MELICLKKMEDCIYKLREYLSFFCEDCSDEDVELLRTVNSSTKELSKLVNDVICDKQSKLFDLRSSSSDINPSE